MLSRTVAIVTGGCSGLGAAAARYLVRNGARVVVADLGSQRDRFRSLLLPSRKDGEEEEATKEGPESSPSPYSSSLAFVEASVTDADQLSAALDVAEAEFGEPVNAAICCAGVAAARKTLSKSHAPHPLDEFERVVTVNTIGTFNVARLAAERMSRRKADADGLRGCIVMTASVAAFEGQAGQVAYAASKGALVGMTLPMARDLAPLGIRVMTIVSAGHFGVALSA